MDQNVEHMLKMIRDDSVSLANKAQLCLQTRPDFISQLDEFQFIYQSLVQHYDHLTAHLNNTIIPSDLQLQLSNNSPFAHAPYSPLLTPDQNLALCNTGHQLASVNSSCATSHLSLKEPSESSSSSSDFESESFNSSSDVYFSLPVSTNKRGLQQKITEARTQFPSMKDKLQMDAQDSGDSVLNVEENGTYEESHRRIFMYEEELRASKLKLQLLEDEIIRLKSELENSESLKVLAGTLQAQLETAQGDIKTREADVEVARNRVLVLQKQMVETTHEWQGQLKLSQEEITMLKAKVNSMLDVQENLSAQNAWLLSDIFNLSEKQKMLEARVVEWEAKCEYLEDKLRQCEAQKIEMKAFHDAQEIGLQGEMSQIKGELMDRIGYVEVLNKNLDSLKLKYDILMAEKDGLDVKMKSFIEDLSHRDNQLGQMEEHIQQLCKENMELMGGNERAEKVVDGLRLRVMELEKEVEEQRIEIAKGAEEKREAIRQLCFSLDYYRSGYKELWQAFIGRKGQALRKGFFIRLHA